MIHALKGNVQGKLLFPANMLRMERDVFLDDLTPEQVAQALETDVCPVENDGYELLSALLG